MCIHPEFRTRRPTLLTAQFGDRQRLPIDAAESRFTPTTGRAGGVIYHWDGICKILPSYQRDVTTIFMTLSLNTLGFGDK